MKNGKRKFSIRSYFKNTHFTHSRYMLRRVILGGCLSMALILPVFAQSAGPIDTTKTTTETFKAQQTPEKSRQLLAQLKQQAVYDEATKASYVFSMPIQDDYLDALMQKENIYYADPHVLVVQIEDDAALVSFQKVGYNYKKIADGIYTVSVSEDIQALKSLLEKTLGVTHVTYNYFLSPLVGGAAYWNDPGIWHDIGSTKTQQWLHDDMRKSNGYPTVITQSVDSIEAVKVFHSATKVNVHVIDQGLNTSSSEYNLKGSYNIETGSTGNGESAHGNAVAADAVGRLNNNYGGGGVAPGFPLFSYDAERSGMPGYLTSNFVKGLSDISPKMIIFVITNHKRHEFTKFCCTISRRSKL